MSHQISVVITTYNGEAYLDKAIESVLAQTYKGFELILWDDGSTDRSLEIANKYAQQDNRIKVVASPHLKRGKALKGAIAATSGKYLGWVDSDDILSPTALEETFKIMEKHPEVGFIYTDYLVMDTQGEIKGLGHRCKIPYSKKNLLLNFMTFHFRLIRRDVYNAVGGINEQFNYADDYDICLRLSEAAEVIHLKKPLYLYRQHSHSMSQATRLEQILQTHEAINQAVERRGLSQTYELELQLIGKYGLRKKKPNGSNSSHESIARLKKLLHIEVEPIKK